MGGFGSLERTIIILGGPGSLNYQNFLFYFFVSLGSVSKFFLQNVILALQLEERNFCIEKKYEVN